MQRKKKNRGGLKKSNSLLTFLANESEDKTAKLLQNLGVKVFNKKDMESKLADFYTNCTDKKEFERKLAEIHPHKDWILRVLAPKKDTIKIEDVKPTEKEIKVSEDAIKRISLLEDRASSNNSNFTGDSNTKINQNDKLVIFGIVTVVAMFGLIVIKTK